MLQQAIPLSLYIHLPWCVQKCPYCDFNSHKAPDVLPEDHYIQQLLQDLAQDSPWASGRNVSTIFIGGGTPSLFSGRAMAHLLQGIKTRVACDENMEITLEANPGTVDQANFVEYFAAGINRLSIGVQSFHDQHLKKLGRIHNRDAAIKAVAVAKKSGFSNFNLDLMYGLPQQTTHEALADLKQAIALQPTHISWYQLTIEPNTLFAVKTPSLPDDENVWDMMQQGQRLLTEHGYQQYEISAYAKANKQCQHNLNYWRFGDYLGIGAGAHAKITDCKTNTILRYSKIKHPKQYLQCDKNFYQEQRQLTKSDRIFEFMLNALRLHQKIDFYLFTSTTGLALSDIEPQLKLAAQRELITLTESGFYLTELGKQFTNDVMGLFLQV